MCGSMAYIQHVMAEIRRGKKDRNKIEETTGQKYNGLPITQGGHNDADLPVAVPHKTQRCWRVDLLIRGTRRVHSTVLHSWSAHELHRWCLLNNQPPSAMHRSAHFRTTNSSTGLNCHKKSRKQMLGLTEWSVGVHISVTITGAAKQEGLQCHQTPSTVSYLPLNTILPREYLFTATPAMPTSVCWFFKRFFSKPPHFGV